MNGRPEVSVVMSVYNGGPTLSRTVESVLSQDHPSFEFLIIDDGSTDETSEVLAELAQVDSRIRIVTQSNQGITAALIRGCAEARGDFVARQDCGDLSLPGRLRLQSEALRDDVGAVLCVCGLRLVTRSGTVVGEIVPDASSEELTRRLSIDMTGVPGHGSVMFRREACEAVGGYRLPFYYSQDCDLWLRLLAHGRMLGVGEVLYEFDIDVGGISTTRSALQTEFARLAHAAHRSRLSGMEDPELMIQGEKLKAAALLVRGRRPDRYQVSAAYYRVAAMLSQAGSGEARSYLWRSIRTCPYYWRAWVRLLGPGMGGN